MLDVTQERAAIDRALVDADRAQGSAAALRERRAELDELERLERDAAQRAREKRAALAAVKVAEDRDREAKAAPLVAALDATTAELADLERETTAKLWEIVRAARAYHARHAALVTKHNATLAALRAVDPEAARAQLVQHPQSLRAFVATRWQRFNGEGVAGDGCTWSRTLAAEEG